MKICSVIAAIKSTSQKHRRAHSVLLRKKRGENNVMLTLVCSRFCTFDPEDTDRQENRWAFSNHQQKSFKSFWQCMITKRRTNRFSNQYTCWNLVLWNSKMIIITVALTRGVQAWFNFFFLPYSNTKIHNNNDSNEVVGEMAASPLNNNSL